MFNKSFISNCGTEILLRGSCKNIAMDRNVLDGLDELISMIGQENGLDFDGGNGRLEV